MRTETLDMIIRTAELGSISAAARDCHVRQTTLSAAIRSVESELGIRIFSRASNGVALTEQGMAFLDLARSVSADCARMRELARPSRPQLTLDVNSQLYCLFCYDVVPQLHMVFPEVSLAATVASNDTGVAGPLPEHEFAIGCCLPDELDEARRRARGNGLALSELCESEFTIYVEKHHPLAKKGSFTDLSDLRGYRMVFDRHCFELFRKTGLDLLTPSYVVIDRPDPLWLIEAAADGDAIAYTVDPQMLPSRARNALIDVVPVTIEEPEGIYLKRLVHYIVRHEAGLSGEEVAMVDCIRELVEDRAARVCN